MELDMISVIIPTYNRATTIKRCIDSVLNQTYSNIEVIIIDDASTDNTEEIVKSYTNDKIKYYKFEKNLGACAARNKGIEIAKGDYIAFQDSDDEWFKNKLEIQMKRLKETNTKFNFCALNRISNKTERKIPIYDVNKIENMTKELLKGNFISTQTMLGEKSVFKEIKFDEQLPRYQDWDLVIRVSKKYKISYTDEILVNSYIQSDSITINSHKKVKATEIIYKKYYQDINKDTELKHCFNIRIALSLFENGDICTEELKVCLKKKISIKLFIYYISCITRTNKIVLKIKKMLR